MKTAKRFAAVSAAGVLCAALFVPAVPAAAVPEQIDPEACLIGAGYHFYDPSGWMQGDVSFTENDYCFAYSDSLGSGNNHRALYSGQPYSMVSFSISAEADEIAELADDLQADLGDRAASGYQVVSGDFGIDIRDYRLRTNLKDVAADLLKSNPALSDTVSLAIYTPFFFASFENPDPLSFMQPSLSLPDGADHWATDTEIQQYFDQEGLNWIIQNRKVTVDTEDQETILKAIGIMQREFHYTPAPSMAQEPLSIPSEQETILLPRTHMVELPESVDVNGAAYHIRYMAGDVNPSECAYSPYLDFCYYYTDDFTDGIVWGNTGMGMQFGVATPFSFMITVDPENDPDALALLADDAFMQSLKDAYDRDGAGTEADFVKSIREIGLWRMPFAALDQEQAAARSFALLSTNAPDGLAHFTINSTGLTQEDLDDALALLRQYPALADRIKSASLMIDLNGPVYDKAATADTPITHGLMFESDGDAEASAAAIPQYIADNSLNWTAEFYDKEVGSGSLTATVHCVNITPDTWSPENVMAILSYMGNTYNVAPAFSVTDSDTAYEPAEVVLWRAPGSGDVTADGRVNIADAIALTQYNTEVADCGVTEEGLANADVNADGEINADDVSALLENLANLSA